LYGVDVRLAGGADVSLGNAAAETGNPLPIAEPRKVRSGPKARKGGYFENRRDFKRLFFHPRRPQAAFPGPEPGKYPSRGAKPLKNEISWGSGGAKGHLFSRYQTPRNQSQRNL